MVPRLSTASFESMLTSAVSGGVFANIFSAAGGLARTASGKVPFRSPSLVLSEPDSPRLVRKHSNSSAAVIAPTRMFPPGTLLWLTMSGEQWESSDTASSSEGSVGVSSAQSRRYVASKIANATTFHDILLMRGMLTHHFIDSYLHAIQSL